MGSVLQKGFARPGGDAATGTLRDRQALSSHSNAKARTFFWFLLLEVSVWSGDPLPRTLKLPVGDVDEFFAALAASRCALANSTLRSDETGSRLSIDLARFCERQGVSRDHVI